MRRSWPVFAILIIVISFFWQFLFKGLLPIPSDTIVGLYHPYRDFYANDYPRGIPYKNFMITDPVRQQYPWKNLVIDAEKNLKLPLWNPYNFSGYPLLANFQSSAFYPLNILFFILPFSFSWGVFILFGPLLAMLFMYLYMNNLKIDKRASIISAIAFGFSGFSVSWLEWGNVVHTALWLPLILFSIDKTSEIVKTQHTYLNPKLLRWQVILLLSLLFSFFAGHLQIFFYNSFIS